MRLHHVACLLTIAVLAQLSSGCCLFPNAGWRLRNCLGCHSCTPAFQTPGSAGPVYSGATYGAPDCASCSGYGGGAVAGQPVSMGMSPGMAMPMQPGVTMIPSPPSVGLPMPKEPEKKN